MAVQSAKAQFFHAVGRTGKTKPKSRLRMPVENLSVTFKLE
jgi:hypothetical protein